MKRRTIGILTLCAVLALLVLNWQTQPSTGSRTGTWCP